MAGIVEWNGGKVMESAWGVTGQNNAKDQWAALRQTRYPFYISEMVGLGEIHLYYSGQLHAFNKDDLTNAMGNAVGWNWNGARIYIHFQSGLEMCSYSAGVPTLEFFGDMANVEFIRLEIEGNARIYGRGADAKSEDDWSGWGAQGGTAIANRIGGKLHINNWGQIYGGGGSGIGDWGSDTARGGGGGGAPLGIGRGSYNDGGSPSTNATFWEGGKGARSNGDRLTMGDGGNPGEKGKTGRYAPTDRGGNPGFFYWAGGSGDAYWIRTGDIKGQIQY